MVEYLFISLLIIVLGVAAVIWSAILARAELRSRKNLPGEDRPSWLRKQLEETDEYLRELDKAVTEAEVDNLASRREKRENP